MTFVQFIEAHPWWTTLWLLILVGGLAGVADRVRK